MTKIRVLVVDDSLTVRKRIVEILAADPGLDVIAEAGDGRHAIELCESLRPDVITLDMMLPVMTGLAATEYIMAHTPTPILIVSASTNRGELFRTYEALAAGAVDVFEKPVGDEVGDDWDRRLVAAVKMVSRIKVITHLRAKLDARPRVPRTITPAAPPSGAAISLIAMGASTGGPGAVAEVLRGLPPDFPLPILLVVHIGEPFGAALADWLDGLSATSVSMATDGQRIPPVGAATVLLAPPSRHLVIRDGRVRLTSDAERHSCRPSVDVLFESVARELGPRACGCLLTGMGRDGATGLLAIKSAGGATIAQDEESSVVYGMPREAVLLGAAERVLPLSRIAGTLSALAPRVMRGAR